MLWDYESESKLCFAVEEYGLQWKIIAEKEFNGYSYEKLRNKYYKMRQRGLLQNYIMITTKEKPVKSKKQKTVQTISDKDLYQLAKLLSEQQ